jgi:hypothetical protein
VSDKSPNKGVVAAALLGLASLAYACFALVTRQHPTSRQSYAVRDAEEASATNSDVDFERSDMSVAVIAVLAIAVLAYICLAPFALTRIYRSALGDASRQLTINPPAPKLQLDAPADLAALNARETTQLASYGWIDRAKGIAHIPLAQAMQDVAAHGIPDFPKAPQ